MPILFQRTGSWGAIILAVCLIAVACATSTRAQQQPLDPLTLTKYLDPLPMPGVVAPVTPGGTYYEIGAYPITQQLHSQLPPTRVWGYGASQATASYPGPTIEVLRGRAIDVKWMNKLFDDGGAPLHHPLIVDQTLDWANPFNVPVNDPSRMLPYTGPVPLVTHVHGAEVGSESDGGPDAWFTPDYALKGMSWDNGVQEVYHYTNTQEPTTLWYHDHAMGMTRLNVYMGLAGFYLLRDVRDARTNPRGVEPANLPAGPREIPLVIQDRMFDTNGQLYFPAGGDNPSIHPWWLPEFFGNTILVNGKVWPYLNVQPCRYRFRILNGSNARFYRLRLLQVDPVTLRPITGPGAVGQLPGPAFYQIGTDGGLLNTPAVLNAPGNPLSPRFMIAPGERADVIIDFYAQRNKAFILYNDAPAPFPDGDPVDPQTTGQIMLIRVGGNTAPDTTYNPTLNQSLRATPMPKLADVRGISQPVPVRAITLVEIEQPNGPEMVLVNNARYSNPITEKPRVGSTEEWDFYNLTVDAHPLHLHLVQFQLLNRQPFDVASYAQAYSAAYPGGSLIPGYGPPPNWNPNTRLYLRPGITGPAVNENGWKDTIQMYPGQVTRLLVRFAPTSLPITAVKAGVNRFPFDPTTGPGYVYHCHIIDHEDNEMMRPYTVAP